MLDNLRTEKKLLRQKMLAERDALSSEARFVKSHEISASLFNQVDIIKAKSIFIYVSFRSEVETHSLINAFIDQGKIVSVPLIDMKKKRLIPCRIKSLKNDLVTGTFGISEPAQGKIKPVPVDEIDLVLVPGVVFSYDGSRIGQGGGFYDRFLQENKVISYALAFEMQLVNAVPFDPLTDMKVDYIVTEKQLVNCG